MKKLNGSSTIEAALVFPLVILTVIGMFTLAIRLSLKVKDEAEKDKAYALNVIHTPLSAENILRIKWVGICIIMPD